VRAFGEYELFRVERGKYELIKGGVVVGTFSDAQVDRERVLFPLSRGMLLEVSENGVIFNSQRGDQSCEMRSAEADADI